MTLAFHQYANLFPLIEGPEFYELAEDIRLHGLRDRVDLVQVGDTPQILDGRNRYRALVWIATSGEVLGPAWDWTPWAGQALPVAALADDALSNSILFSVGVDGDWLDYVLSKNLNRRHLTDDQRRMLGARLVNMRPGRQAQSSQIAKIGREQAAELAAVDVAGVDRARSVIARAAPEVVAAVDEGALSVAAAAEVAAQPAERQREIVQVLTRGEDGRLTPEARAALAPLIREVRAERIKAKRDKREQREQEFGRRIQALPDKKFGLAIEDFEWHHAAWSEATGSEKSPSMHYETAVDAQTPEAIVARCAERFACLADDCIILKWTTIPHLAIAIKVLELQGFRYVSQLVWNKERAGDARGPGYWVTGEHEIVLIGVRGNVVPPATAHFRSNFSAPVGAHSEKPDNVHEFAEYHWPNVPKVEFNARRRRPGWKAWGFDAPVASPEGEVDMAIGASGSSSPAPTDERTAPDGCADCFNESDCASVDACRAVEQVYKIAPLGAPVSDLNCFETACTSRDDCLADGCRKLAAGATDSRAELPAPPADMPSVPGDGIVDAQPDRVAPDAPAVPPADRPGIYSQRGQEENALYRENFDALNAVFCHPRRAEIAAAVGAEYQEKGLAIKQTASGEWILRDAGKARLQQLESERRAAAPAPAHDPLQLPDFLRRVKRPPTARPQQELDLLAPLQQQSELDLARIDRTPAEVVDGKLQTRLPLTDDELAMREALVRLVAGGDHGVETEMVRHLIGAGFAFATTKRVALTEQGEAFVAQLVAPAAEGARA